MNTFSLNNFVIDVNPLVRFWKPVGPIKCLSQTLAFVAHQFLRAYIAKACCIAFTIQVKNAADPVLFWISLEIRFIIPRGMISDQLMLNRKDVTHVEKYTRCITDVFNLNIDDTGSQIMLNQHGFPFPIISFQCFLTQHRKPCPIKTAFLKCSLNLSFHFQWW